MQVRTIKLRLSDVCGMNQVHFGRVNERDEVLSLSLCCSHEGRLSARLFLSPSLGSLSDATEDVKNVEERIAAVIEELYV